VRQRPSGEDGSLDRPFTTRENAARYISPAEQAAQRKADRIFLWIMAAVLLVGLAAALAT
jgi:type VI protein secretion system component VasF